MKMISIKINDRHPLLCELILGEQRSVADAKHQADKEGETGGFR